MSEVELVTLKQVNEDIQAKAVNPRLYVPSFLSPWRRSPTAFNPSRCPPFLPQPIAFVRIWWDSLIGAPTGIGYFNVMDPFLQEQRFPVPSADSSNEKIGVLLNRSVITAARLNSGKEFFSPCPMVQLMACLAAFQLWDCAGNFQVSVFVEFAFLAMSEFHRQKDLLS